MAERDRPEVRFQVCRNVLPRALVGDRPEIVGPGPRDAPFAAATDRREQVPRHSVVGIQPGWDRGGIASVDEQAAVWRPEADLAYAANIDCFGRDARARR